MSTLPEPAFGVADRIKFDTKDDNSFEVQPGDEHAKTCDFCGFEGSLKNEQENWFSLPLLGNHKLSLDCCGTCRNKPMKDIILINNTIDVPPDPTPHKNC